MKGYLARPVMLACAACQTPFQATRPQSRYCSPACAREGIRASQRRHAERYPERKQENARRQYQKNRDAVLKRTTQYRRTEKGRAVAAESQRRRRENSPEIFRARDAVRRARNGVGGGSKELAAAILEIMELQRGRCAYCRVNLAGAPGGWELDHIVALVNGGTNDRANLQCLCANCNASKADRDPASFARSRGLLI